MTHKAALFLAANARSPVVYGSVLTDPRWRGDGPPPSRGCYYRLADGKTFRLGLADCRAVVAPRWAFEDAIAEAV
jgi:hypothetical protein